MPHRIAIIGGGYVGIELAKSLENIAEVTLIEQNSHFVHAPAMVRAVVDPSILARALIPYDTLLQRGRIVRAVAQSVSETGVTLASGEEIAADHIIVATGSHNAVPFKSNGGDIERLRAANARVHDQLVAAKTVAIVGAGAVGTELAGEIAHAFPEKSVHLVSSESDLFPQHPAKLGRALTAKLQASGVSLTFGVRAQNLQSLTEPFAGTLSLSNGTEIASDLVFPVIGSKASSSLLQSLPGAQLGQAERIKTDAWMRPSQLRNVFAAGDVAEAGDAMTIVSASRQISWLKKTLKAVIAGKNLEDLKPYTPWGPKAPFLVPLGPKIGNSFLGAFTAGDFLTRKLKGTDLFLSKYNKLLGRDA
ncbi:NADH dehydrogenase, FAD-containing subunit [Yoonia tamlensis]|uniref:NADH dehydrogenase, FAD-containing subunit n=1 Tax=Yoonia tamlensis TaxID=390270 RepID=A0A1I6HPM3_9RHOB|nr:FAD-dependent oxidoreductase [Yoonia tamlensis]SFR56403.1 NADH dehydrogenase, FAD-containing subunit [Yoonia tamlensis]